MFYLWSTILIIINAFWLTLVPFALPGNWLIIITTALFAWWHADENMFSVYTLIIITILAILGELVEFLGGVTGAKKAGAGFRGSLGAIIGAVTGAIIGTFLIPIPLLGTLLGSCAGAAILACLFEVTGGRKLEDTVQLGFGAGLGVFLGTSAKIFIGILIWHIVAIAAFWP
ncbi:MAG: DUF456 domain-containing protein [Phycisphaerae bacterium]|nr:DUF456 domain-containing protein [Phycisphaerae bacterium]